MEKENGGVILRNPTPLWKFIRKNKGGCKLKEIKDRLKKINFRKLTFGCKKKQLRPTKNMCVYGHSTDPNFC